jgi:rhodanese-related sulfurtransferase
MKEIRQVLLVFMWCLFFNVSLPAQTGAYFQAVVKDAKARIREITVLQLGTLQQAGPLPLLVDVREDNEWDQGRIPGAIHVGRGVLEVQIESRVPQKSTHIVVYCRSGGRSAVAADVLGKMGYTNVSSLAGGMAAYQAAGLPMDKAAPKKTESR